MNGPGPKPASTICCATDVARGGQKPPQFLPICFSWQVQLRKPVRDREKHAVPKIWILCQPNPKGIRRDDAVGQVGFGNTFARIDAVLDQAGILQRQMSPGETRYRTPARCWWSARSGLCGCPAGQTQHRVRPARHGVFPSGPDRQPAGRRRIETTSYIKVNGRQWISFPD